MRDADDEILGFFGFHMFLPECRSDEERKSAEATLKEDISPVFPYINARIKAYYNPDFPFIRFKWKGHVVTLHPHKIMVSNLMDSQEAAEIFKELRLFINETWLARDKIKPSFEVRKKPPVPEILKRLPKTNCGRCGYPSCVAFAAALSDDDAELASCRPLYEEEKYQQARKELEELIL